MQSQKINTFISEEGKRKFPLNGKLRSPTLVLFQYRRLKLIDFVYDHRTSSHRVRGN